MNDTPNPPPRPAAPGDLARRAWTLHGAARAGLGVLLIVALAAALWSVRNVLLLLFAGVLLGIVLYGASDRMGTALRMPRLLALMLILAVVVGAIGLLVWRGGPGLAEQFEQLLRNIGDTADDLVRLLDGAAAGEIANLNWRDLLDVAPSPWGIATGATAVIGGVLGAVASISIVAVFGVWLAADPDTYTRLALRLAPPERRARAAAILREIASILRWWLKGQIVAMVVIGLATYVGLLAIGMPFALPLALFAGLTNFVPYIGPLASGAAIVLVATGEGATMVLWALGLYVVIQSFESAVLVPYIQSKAVRLPPIVVIANQLLFGALFGVLGIMLATPIVAAATVPLKRLVPE